MCRSSLRTVNLYNVGTGSHLSEISTSIAPATLIPYYDCDTKLLFLSGKVWLSSNVNIVNYFNAGGQYHSSL